MNYIETKIFFFLFKLKLMLVNRINTSNKTITRLDEVKITANISNYETADYCLATESCVTVVKL